MADLRLDALRSSVERLRRIAEPLTGEELTASAYPSEWTVAEVLSHIGSGAVIMRRRLDDGITGEPTAEEFASGVWDEWNAKAPDAQRDDALVADGELLARIESVTAEERERFTFDLGPMTFDFQGFLGLRLNEHALHTWDIEVAGDPAATLPAGVVGAVVDNLGFTAAFTSRPDGRTATITVGTTDPVRAFSLALTPEGAQLSAAPSDAGPFDLELPAEAFARLVYGRLDPSPTPAGESPLLAELRSVYPGF